MDGLGLGLGLEPGLMRIHYWFTMNPGWGHHGFTLGFCVLGFDPSLIHLGSIVELRGVRVDLRLTHVTPHKLQLHSGFSVELHGLTWFLG